MLPLPGKSKQLRKRETMALHVSALFIRFFSLLLESRFRRRKVWGPDAWKSKRAYKMCGRDGTSVSNKMIPWGNTLNKHLNWSAATIINPKGLGAVPLWNKSILSGIEWNITYQSTVHPRIGRTLVWKVKNVNWVSWEDVSCYNDLSKWNISKPTFQREKNLWQFSFAPRLVLGLTPICI